MCTRALHASMQIYHIYSSGSVRKLPCLNLHVSHYVANLTRQCNGLTNFTFNRRGVNDLFPFLSHFGQKKNVRKKNYSNCVWNYISILKRTILGKKNKKNEPFLSTMIHLPYSVTRWSPVLLEIFSDHYLLMFLQKTANQFVHVMRKNNLNYM